MTLANSIWNDKLRYWIEGGLHQFYFYTFGTGPALLGYAFGRWLPAYLRGLALLFILPAGYWWTRHSDHGFQFYIIGNLLYSGFCVLGLYHRTRKQKIPFWSLYHYDWITVVLATFVLMAVYTPPMA